MDIKQFKLEIVTLKESHSVITQIEKLELIVEELAVALNEGIVKLDTSKSEDLKTIVLIPREKIEYIKLTQLKE